MPVFLARPQGTDILWSVGALSPASRVLALLFVAVIMATSPGFLSDISARGSKGLMQMDTNSRTPVASATAIVGSAFFTSLAANAAPG